MSKPASHAETEIGGQHFCLWADGSCYLPADQLLVLSDLHLEKAIAQSVGAPLPALDSAASLAAMRAALLRQPVRACILLGDSFHRSDLAGRMASPLQALLQECASQAELIWIEGNHDPDLPPTLPGQRADEVAIGNLLFRHIPQPSASWPAGLIEISGHLHPKARLKLAARNLSGRCFIADSQRLILPAFGVWTGGLNILDPAIADLFGRRKTVWFCHDGKIWTMPFKKSSFLP